MRVPDVPPRDFEIRLLKWIGYPLLVLVGAGFLAWSCDVRDARSACEQRCTGEGSGEFIYIPADRLRGRVEECICGTE